MIFNNIRNNVERHFENVRYMFELEIENKSNYMICNTWSLHDYLTEGELARVRSLDSDALIDARTTACLLKKHERSVARKQNDTQTRLASVENAPIASMIDVTVEWVKNRTWGYNPHCKLFANGSYFSTGRASGCGYDKESACITQALNENPAILAIVYNYVNNGGLYSKGGIDTLYGLPYFDTSGRGVYSIKSLFSDMGYDFRCVGSGDLFTCYTIEKRGI